MADTSTIYMFVEKYLFNTVMGDLDELQAALKEYQKNNPDKDVSADIAKVEQMYNKAENIFKNGPEFTADKDKLAQIQA